MLMRLALFATVLGVAVVNAYSGGNNYKHNDNNPYGEKVSVKSRNVGTIYNPTQVHYSKSVSTSRSRKDTYENYDTASVLNLHKTIVSTDKYIKDVVKIRKPLRVQHVNRHHHLTTVLHDHPVQKNLRLTRYRQIVKPAEETIITNSNSRSQKRVWHTPVIINKAKSVRMPTKVEATRWLPTKYNNEYNYGWNDDGNEKYNNNKKSSKKTYYNNNKNKSNNKYNNSNNKKYYNNNKNANKYKSDDSDFWI